MWPFMPADLLSDCPMLPRGCPTPSAGAFTGSDDTRSASTAGAAFMTAQHLDGLSGALADASASHPRIHSVWLTLLSLLIPGFTPVKVRECHQQQCFLYEVQRACIQCQGSALELFMRWQKKSPAIRNSTSGGWPGSAQASQPSRCYPSGDHDLQDAELPLYMWMLATS